MDNKKLSTIVISCRIVFLTNKLSREHHQLRDLNVKKELNVNRQRVLENKFNLIDREKTELTNLKRNITEIEKNIERSIERKKLVEKNIKLEKKTLCAKKILEQNFWYKS